MAPKQRTAAVAAADAAAAVAVDAAAVVAVDFEWQRGFLQPPLSRRWLENLDPFSV